MIVAISVWQQGTFSIQSQCYEYLRRSFSHVAAELVRLYQTNENDKASSLLDSVMRGLKRPDTHKETTLLVLGYIAKYVGDFIHPPITVHLAKGCCGPGLGASHLFDIFPDRKAKPRYPRNRIPTGWCCGDGC